MPLSLVKQPLSLPSDGAWARVDVTFDSSYLTGGELLVPADLGFVNIIACVPVGTTPLGRTVRFTGTTLKVLEQSPLAKIRSYVHAGGAAGAFTLTGLLTTDNLLSVIAFQTTAGAITSLVDLLGAGHASITGADTLTTTTTDTTSGFLVVQTSRPSDGAAAEEVPSTTDLSAETVTLLVLGTK